jgi:uncharacterized protein (DUF2062 family)
VRHKFFRKYLPEPEAVLAKPWCAPFRPWLGHPNLWHLNRRSVAGAMAIGLFCGLIPGPFQMLGALILSIPLRRNIPVALVVTFYTNPLTILPLYIVAFEYGSLILGWKQSHAAIEPFAMDWADWAGSAHAFVDWCISLGRPLAVGLVALALTLAALGYVAVDFAWRWSVITAWRRRAATRRADRKSAPHARRDPDRG